MRIFVTTIENSPSRVHITMYEGHGIGEKAMRKELSDFEMMDLHRKLTEALWARLKSEDETQGQTQSG